MAPTILEPPITNWYCPNCGQTAQRKMHEVHTVFHPCARLRGVMTPMLMEGVKGRSKIVDREDYGGTDTLPQDGEGNVIMSVVTERDDGQDCTIFAPCINLNLES